MDDKKILIVCESGISAALFVSKFIEEAEQKEIPLLVEYAPIQRIDKKLQEMKYDIVLLMPQVTRHEETLRGKLNLEQPQCQIMLVDEEDFAFMNIPNIFLKLGIS